jgi:hypothetical protein
MIVEVADDAAALSTTDCQRQAAQIQGDLLSVERDMAWFVRAGISQGLPVWFGDISPAAILGAKLVTLPAGDRPGSSPEHASYSLIGGRQ